MRTTINHTGPSATQPMPIDNTGNHVQSQVFNYAVSGKLIHVQSAMEIAAWHQSPGDGIGMERFASTGTITDALLEDLDATLTATMGDEATELRALRAYVHACEAPAFSIGCNTAGYLPEGDVYTFLSYADAAWHFAEMLKAAPENLVPDEVECTCVDGGELCDLHGLEAEVGAFIADEVDDSSGRDMSIALCPESDSLPTIFWLAATEVNVADYVAEQH